MKSAAFRTDPLLLRNRQFMTGEFDIPFVYAQNIDISKIALIGFDKTRHLELSSARRAKTVHFFLDDYKFDEVWNKPEKQIHRLRQYTQVLSPDFSLYADMPEPLQVYNTFRNRWCAAVWQAARMAVIPTISWGSDNTFDFCFDGIETGSVVAVSTVGTQLFKEYFMRGYTEMCLRLDPKFVIVYGSVYEHMTEFADIVSVPYSHGSNTKES